MSIESDIRQALLSRPQLLALVPAGRVCIDAVPQGQARPYIAFSKQAHSYELGLDNSTLGESATVDVQCIGNTRGEAIAVADQVRAALLSAGQPSEAGSAGYDPDNDIEAEIVTVNWLRT